MMSNQQLHEAVNEVNIRQAMIKCSCHSMLAVNVQAILKPTSDLGG